MSLKCDNTRKKSHFLFEKLKFSAFKTQPGAGKSPSALQAHRSTKNSPHFQLQIAPTPMQNSSEAIADTLKSSQNNPHQPLQPPPPAGVHFYINIFLSLYPILEQHQKGAPNNLPERDEGFLPQGGVFVIMVHIPSSAASPRRGRGAPRAPILPPAPCSRRRQSLRSSSLPFFGAAFIIRVVGVFALKKKPAS
jgi:hypothetical protein